MSTFVWKRFENLINHSELQKNVSYLLSISDLILSWAVTALGHCREEKMIST